MVPLLGAQIALFCYVFPLCEGGEEEPERRRTRCRPPLSLFCCSDVSFLSSLLPTSSSVCEYRTSGIGKPADRPTDLGPDTQIRIRLRYSISRSSQSESRPVNELLVCRPTRMFGGRASVLLSDPPPADRRTLFLLIATSFLPTWPT